MQFFQFAGVVGLEKNGIARVILGSTFDWLDILAYTLGTLAAYFIDRKYLKKN
ncbi:MAG: DUF2809 domain-containing protein [Crocinitomix sp.]|nr:DUF2809 domain-containing protein [Crocinitomix sp.]